jgi:thiol:disulfide interchange protein/DsbC/DsbD-like thiol-disulfide interchange protein
MLRHLPLFAAGVAALAAAAAIADPVRTAHVEAELVSAQTALVPGSPSTVALRLKMDRGWHTYWRNPGDSGLPTTIAWKLPTGLSAGPIEWPAPRALPVGPLVNYGYDDEVLLLSEIAATPELAGNSANLTARADWLVCKDICIPEGADLALTLPVAKSASPDPHWAGPIAAARAALPRPLEGWSVAATGRGAEVELTLRPRAPTELGQVHFFPYSEGKIEASGRQTLTRSGSMLTLMLPVASQRVGEFTRVAGVLTSSKGFDGHDAAAIDVPLAGAVVAGAPPAGAATAGTALPIVEDANRVSFGVALLFALFGGALLNLMPCIFPVLSLKVLGFASHGGGAAGMRAHGLAFGGGVVLSFVALAVILVALRATGQQLGWGFQLQSPAIIVGLAILFFVLALNLSGVFEVGQLLPSAVSSWSARNSYMNDALSGLVAVVVASPCSAPFMGAALGYALAENNAATLATFTALGIGMALPYLGLAFFPAWRSKLPKPGPWMIRLRQLLAFPLYGTVIWLAWVLSMQLDNDAVARLLAVLLLIAFALWAWQTMRSGGALRWGVAAAVGLVAAAIVGWPVMAAVTADNPPAPKAIAAEKGPWQDFTPERVRELTGAGRAVFVDFTAAWCVTCQVNKIALNSDAVRGAFAQKNVALLRADWTRRDPVIGQALASLGRNGIPVYVLYRPGREPLLLPEVLQKSTITDALATL